MKILLLGASGYIGQNLLRVLHINGYDVVTLTRNAILNIPSTIKQFHADFRNFYEIKNCLDGVDTVIHMISSSIPLSDSCDITKTAEYTGTEQLLRASSEYGIKQILYISSAGTIYGPSDNQFFTEETPPRPISFYARTKLAIEDMIKNSTAYSDLKYTIARVSNPYGYGERINQSQNVINNWILNILNGHPISIWGELDQSRDFIYIDDLLGAIMCILALRFDNSTYNVAYGESRTLGDILSILHSMRSNIELILKGDMGLIKHVNISSDKFKAKYNWVPHYDLRRGLEQSYKYFSAHYK